MSINIPLFPIKQIDKFTSSPYEFFYTKNDEEFKLDKENIDSSTIGIVDNEGNWSANTHNLGFRSRYTIHNCCALYGENGVASATAELGIAIMWTSKTSRQRGMIPFGIINCKQNIQDFDVCGIFEIGQLRGELNFSTVIYIKTPGTPQENEKHLANVEGCVVGTIDDNQFVIDGSGSELPITTVNKPGAPLWEVVCNWEFPCSEQLVDTFAICLNEAHKDYKFIDIKSGKISCEPLMREIVSSALVILVAKLRETSFWDDIKTGNNIEEGSVGQVVYYWIKQGIISNPDEIINVSISLRKHLEPKE